VFRALEHEGVASECLFELFAGGRRMSSDQRLHVFAACAVMAATMKVMRGRGQ
jgi:hypothetical protein